MDITEKEIKEAQVFRMSILLTGREAERAKKRLIEEYGGIPLRDIFGKIKKKLPDAVRVSMPEKLKAELLSGETSMKSEEELFAEKNLNPDFKNDIRRLPRIMYKKGSYMIKMGDKTFYWVDKQEYERFEATPVENRFLSPAHLSDTVHAAHLFLIAQMKIDAEFPVNR